MPARIVVGDKKLDAYLQKLSATAANKLARRAARTAAKLIAQDAKAIVPHDSGKYSRSLTVRALPRSRVRSGYKVTQRDYTARPGQKPAWYGKFLELGWTAGGKKRGPKRRASISSVTRAARPLRPRKVKGGWYIRTAGRRKEAAAIQLYREELSRLLESTK